jgi:hypothetical protein
MRDERLAAGGLRTLAPLGCPALSVSLASEGAAAARARGLEAAGGSRSAARDVALSSCNVPGGARFERPMVAPDAYLHFRIIPACRAKPCRGSASRASQSLANLRWNAPAPAAYPAASPDAKAHTKLCTKPLCERGLLEPTGCARKGGSLHRVFSDEFVEKHHGQSFSPRAAKSLGFVGCTPPCPLILASRKMRVTVPVS